MDAFFASVEEREDPSLRKLPLIIARDPIIHGNKSVVTTANYIARKFGIHSGMSARRAMQLCPYAVFKYGGYDKYAEVSKEINEIFFKYTDLVEAVSVDESFLDVTTNHYEIKSALKIAKLIQYDIYKQLNLTCSVGVSYTKFLAKMASNHMKPMGVTMVTPDITASFLDSIKITDFYGIGKKTAEKLLEHSISTGRDLASLSEGDLIDKFGLSGSRLFDLARGGIRTSKEVNPNKKRKSLGKEFTFIKNEFSEEQIFIKINELSKQLKQKLDKNQVLGKNISVKIHYSDFELVRFSETFLNPTNDEFEITRLFKYLVETNIEWSRGIRMIGVSIGGLQPESFQNLSLFDYQTDLWETEK